MIVLFYLNNKCSYRNYSLIIVLFKLKIKIKKGRQKREEEGKEEVKCEDRRGEERRGEGVMFQNANVLCY